MRKTVKLILTTLILIIPFFGYSQTKDEAGEAYNEGLEFVKSNQPDDAITSFDRAIGICTEVGFEADDLKDMAEQQLPAQYYKSATTLYKSKKIDEAISRYEETVVIATKYNNEEFVKKSNNAIPQLYNLKGTSYYKKKDYDNALKYCDIATQKNPEYAKAYYSKALVYNKKKDAVKMKESFDMAITKAEARNDEKTTSRSKKAAKKYLENYAVKSIQNNKFDDALMYLDQAVGYGKGSANTFYYYAIAYNKKSKWDDALTAGNKALELEKDEKDPKAKIHFEIGTAYYGKGDSANACKSYKEALYGAHVEQANYQIKEVLKCK